VATPDATAVFTTDPVESQRPVPLIGPATAPSPQNDANFMRAMRFIAEQESRPGYSGQVRGGHLADFMASGEGLAPGGQEEEYHRTHPGDTYNQADPHESAQYGMRVWHDLWTRSGANTLPPNLGLVHMDAAVQHGPGIAKQMLAASGGDPEKYLALREEYYRSIPDTASEGGVAQNPGWLEKRMPALRAAIATPVANLRSVGRIARRASTEE
jgi:hypothetical protein